jgi:hypothetical protein
VPAKDLVERIGHDKSITFLLSVDQQRTTASLEERLIYGDSGHIGIEKREASWTVRLTSASPCDLDTFPF